MLSLQLLSKYWFLAACLPLVCFVACFPDYLIRYTFFWICLITLPFSFIQNSANRFPFFVLAIFVGLVTIALPTKIGIYVFACCIVLLTAQKMIGGIHVIGLIHTFIASPFFSYISNLISFPIRLQLSKAVSRLLNMGGYCNEIEGNVILINSKEFLVDQACSGMYLLGYGILFGTLILSFRIRRKDLNVWSLAAYYMLLFVLIIWGNVVRICVLVITQVEADSWMHEAIGLLLFVFQILAPFYLIVNYSQPSGSAAKGLFIPKSANFPLFQYALLIVLFIVMVRGVSMRDANSQKGYLPAIEGFESETFNDEVLKYHNDEALVYIKRPVAAYSADHNPMICWSGSGYSFNKIDKVPFAHKLYVNTATLKKDQDVLYTAWWFESTNHKTGSQWQWRKTAIKEKENFYLVNVTCSTEQELNATLKNLLTEGVIGG